MRITASKLRESIYKILDRVLKTGYAVEIERKGKLLRIIPAESVSKLSALESRPETIVGDAEDLVHIDWSKEWRP